MKLFKRLPLLILLSAVLLCFCGCIQSAELKERTIIKMVGVDADGEDFKLTMLQFSPQPGEGGKSGKPKAVVVQTGGKTISEAINKLSEYNGNEVFLGNLSFLIVGREAAEKGLERCLSFFNANHEISPELYIAMADSAEEIIRAKAREGSDSGQMKSLAQQGQENGLLGKPTLRDVMNRLQSDCADPYLPMLKKVKLTGGEDSLKISGMAVFKDGSLCDTLSIEETRGVLWATDELKSALISVDFGEGKKSRAAVELTDSKSRVKVKIVDDKPVFFLTVRCKGRMHEVNLERGGGASVEELTEIETQVAAKIKSTIRRTVDKVLFEDKSDVFRYSEFIKKYHPDFWKKYRRDWENLIDKIEFRIYVDCSIDHPGLEIKHRQQEGEQQSYGA